MHVRQLQMVGNRASAHMELINDQSIHLAGSDRCRQFGEVHIDQLFKQLHRIQYAGLSLQFSQLLENLVGIPDRKRLANDDAIQTVFLKERRRIRNAEKRNPMAPLLKVQSQAAGGIHMPLGMDREKSDMRHGSYHGRARADFVGTGKVLALSIHLYHCQGAKPPSPVLLQPPAPCCPTKRSHRKR